MNHFVDEKTVMRFYLEQMDAEQIEFLREKSGLKEQIRAYIEQLLNEDKMNNKISIASKLWKVLFEAAMTSINPDKAGYDKLFKYFDAYVEFEELIFASDSFYRDHTLHCIWVYLLGEYLKRNVEFKDLFQDSENDLRLINLMDELFQFGELIASHKEKYEQFNDCFNTQKTRNL